jgi:perosamine synthetase
MNKKSLTRRQFLGRTSAGLAAASLVPVGLAGCRAGRSPVGGNPNALALKGGTPVRSQPYPGWPQTDQLDEEMILKALRNHRWCTYDGEFVPKFEKAWSAHVGARGCVMTPCGTHALHTALEVLGVGPGDEVLVCPFTYIATVDAILLCYALPVFVDPDLRTFQMSPDDLEHRINENTRAILPIHITGGAADLDRILAIARKHNLPVVEDACQAHVTEWQGKRVGTFGTLGCFSFQETKVLPGGEAGALVSDNPELIHKAYTFRDFGRDPAMHAESFSIRGTKYRISEFAPAVLMAQITRFDKLCAVRDKNAAYLRKQLSQVPGIHLQEFYPQNNRQTHYTLALRCDKAHFSNAERGNVMKALKAEGIPVGLETPPLHREPYLRASLESRGFRKVFSKERLERYWAENRCPNNDQLCATHFLMPHAVLEGTQRDVDDIVEAFAKVQKNAASIA